MPAPSFHLKLSTEIRREFDAEIRRRGYGDCSGLVEWLKMKGVSIGKNRINMYENQLRKQDESFSFDGLSPATARAVVEAVSLALKTFDAI